MRVVDGAKALHLIKSETFILPPYPRLDKRAKEAKNLFICTALKTIGLTGLSNLRGEHCVVLAVVHEEVEEATAGLKRLGSGGWRKGERDIEG